MLTSRLKTKFAVATSAPGDQVIMTTAGRSTHTHEPVPDHEQKRVALGYLNEAWAEARLDGIDGDCLAQACLFAALAEFVSTYGEEAAATFTEGSRHPYPQRRIHRRSAAAIAPPAAAISRHSITIRCAAQRQANTGRQANCAFRP